MGNLIFFVVVVAALGVAAYGAHRYEQRKRAAAIALARPGATPQPAAMVVTLNLLAPAAGQTCAGAVPAPAATLDLPWLTVPDGSALGASPAARVSWGRARGEFISVRERFD